MIMQGNKSPSKIWHVQGSLIGNRTHTHTNPLFSGPLHDILQWHFQSFARSQNTCSSCIKRLQKNAKLVEVVCAVILFKSFFFGQSQQTLGDPKTSVKSLQACEWATHVKQVYSLRVRASIFIVRTVSHEDWNWQSNVLRALCT